MADDTPAPVEQPIVETPPPVEGAPPAPAPAPEPAPAPVPAATSNIPAPVFERIDRLTKDKKTAEERAAALDRENAALRAQLAPAPTPAPAPVPGMSAEDIERRAQEIANERAFTATCNSIAAAGASAHADFTLRTQQLDAIGVLSPALIQAAVEVGDPHELLYALGADLTEAARIAGLNPAQQAVALMRFDEARRAKAKETISRAPAPAGASVGGGSPPADDGKAKPGMKSDDWFARREKEIGIASGNYN